MSRTLTDTDREFRKKIQALSWDAYSAGQESLWSDDIFRDSETKEEASAGAIASYWIAVGHAIEKAINAFKAEN